MKIMFLKFFLEDPYTPYLRAGENAYNTCLIQYNEFVDPFIWSGRVIVCWKLSKMPSFFMKNYPTDFKISFKITSSQCYVLLLVTRTDITSFIFFEDIVSGRQALLSICRHIFFSKDIEFYSLLSRVLEYISIVGLVSAFRKHVSRNILHWCE